MRKRINLFCDEKITKDEVRVQHGIYNGWGKVADLPSTTEIRLIKENFDTQELGDLFIKMGELLKRETFNITNISINYSFAESVSHIGKQFMVALEYDTVEERCV